MKFSIAKDVLKLTRAANITTFIWGHRGLGKSSMVREFCVENGLGFIDMRCSQLEASDIRGLPDRKDGRTVYLPPSDLPVADLSLEQANAMIEKIKDVDERATAVVNVQPRLKQGVLFLDEINRAQDDVLQAVFQLVLDRRIGQYVLPQGWSIVCAGNFMEGYQVNGFNDPAFLNRFAHITIDHGEHTMPEWIDYMATVHGESASQVVEFCSQNLKFLDGDVKGAMGFVVQPSRRSWDAVVRVEHAVKNFEKAGVKLHPEARYSAIAGLVGQESAIGYDKYNCPVKPIDIIEKGVKKCADKLSKLNRNQITGLTWGLISFIKNKINSDDDTAQTALDYVEWLSSEQPERDIVVAFCHALVKNDDEHDEVRVAMLSNPKLAQAFFNKKKKAGKLTFLERINASPKLQGLISNVAWGNVVKK